MVYIFVLFAAWFGITACDRACRSLGKIVKDMETDDSYREE